MKTNIKKRVRSAAIMVRYDTSSSSSSSFSLCFGENDSIILSMWWWRYSGLAMAMAT
jgi:hypothetical protein